MGLYTRYVFPRVCRLAMSAEHIAGERHEALAAAQGEVLEIGFGAGLNLPYYPAAVSGLVAVEPNPGMHRLAARPAAEAAFPVDLRLGAAERLPVEAGRFDTAVSTWTLCSVADVGAVLDEILRVLRPGGRLLFLEHGLSHEGRIARWQRRLTPLQKRIADGCHLDRDFAALLGASPFELASCERFYLPKSPKVMGYHYRGLAVKE